MSLKSLLILFLIFGSVICFEKAKAEVIGGLNRDTVNIKLYGAPINWGSALNIKLLVSNPEAVKLDLAPPVFSAKDAVQLVTASDPQSNTVTVIWDGYISDNEANISFMLKQGTVMGVSEILIDKIELAGGYDITHNVVALLDHNKIVNSFGKEITLFGKFELFDPGKLIAPGTASIAFQAEELSPDAAVKLNGKEAQFTENNIGTAQVPLPLNGGSLDLTLNVASGGENKAVKLGKVAVAGSSFREYPPSISRAVALNLDGKTRLILKGRNFGVRRFGKDGVSVQVIPANEKMTNKNLRRQITKERLGDISCIPEGSYVNISHPAGTVTKKIIVRGECF